MDNEFEKYLEKIEDPNYEGETNFILSETATDLEKAKYELCKRILTYKLVNNLSREQIAQKIQLSKAETEDILFAKINNFTLDRLMTYASRLFSPSKVKITIEEKTLHA